MCYDLMRALHFANKLELLIENCPRTLRNEDAQLRVSVPEHQTKDAIKEIKLHLDKMLKQFKELDYFSSMALSGDPERFAWEHGRTKEKENENESIQIRQGSL